jgi:FAD/FMN-containing dehydrogenase
MPTRVGGADHTLGPGWIRAGRDILRASGGGERRRSWRPTAASSAAGVVPDDGGEGMAMTIPRVDEDAASAAIADLARALGGENVLTGAEELREYRDPYDYQGSDRYTGSAVVTPCSVEDVQAIVQIANERLVPLWTFSQGRNYTYGGAAPRVHGSIQVSLRKMNRVLEVDDELAYAVVEPGVRFFDLYDHLQAGGHPLWPSIPDLGWGSVVGNTLDSGRGYTPSGDHPTIQCGLEVVLANGEVLRTGMGGLTGSRSWHLFRESYGPNHSGLFFQSNLGIVTKMGVWLMRAPQMYVSGWAHWAEDETVAAVVDALRELTFEGVIRNHPLIGPGARSEKGFDPSLGGWMVRFALYGREPIVEAHWKLVAQTLGAIEGVEVDRMVFSGDAERSGALMHDDKVQGGVPGLELIEFYTERFGVDAGHLDLSAIVPLSGSAVLESIALRRRLTSRYGPGQPGGIIMLPRSALHISTSIFDTRDEAATRAAYDAYASMAVELARAGFPVYRTNIQHMDLIAGLFDWGDHVQRRLNEQLKDLLDPNGILSPGKQGVWPASMRPARRQ